MSKPQNNRYRKNLARDLVYYSANTREANEKNCLKDANHYALRALRELSLLLSALAEKKERIADFS